MIYDYDTRDWVLGGGQLLAFIYIYLIYLAKYSDERLKAEPEALLCAGIITSNTTLLCCYHDC